MSSSTAADRLKKVMRIALVGIRPADQVMLKGYLRILLRLEADLEWVSANHPQIDLFMINSEFQHAESIQRLLSSMPDSATLFISRADNEDGSLIGNLLSLPLKDLDKLNQWFHANLSFLAPLKNSSGLSKASTQPTASQPKRPQSVDDILASRAAQGNSPLAAQTLVTPAQANMQTQPNAQQTILLSVAKVILQLQRRDDAILSLNDTQGNVLAYIQPKQQRVWPVADSVTFDKGWVLSPNAMSPSVDVAQSQDLVHWLWSLAMTHTTVLQKLLYPQQRYHLTSWIKPAEGPARHEQLKCQCVLEARAVTLQELENLAQVTTATAQQTVLGLLLSGLMSIDAYKNLPAIAKQASADAATETTNVISAQPAAMPATTATSHATAAVSNEVAATQASQDGADNGMKSFLSRLRRKLGI